MSASKSPKKSKLLTPYEVADLLLIAPVTVRLWASRGLLPSVSTPGGHRRFRAEDVDAFIAKQRNLRRPERSRPSRVLIIDDDSQFARYLFNMLRTHLPGSSIEIAADGFSAGMKCEAIRPDVVTLDLQMPGMDGFEVCRLLRGMPSGTSMRIVALTGFASDENVAKITAAGANACLAKTVTTKRLLRELGFAAA
ncbi:MAG TPA: response regulator [Steroidobacteraceae bacterium]|nr:response regulator [Steroidobacteraceae bacterium]